jgi:hypothetical protein
MARRRSFESTLYRSLRQYNDARSVGRAVESGDPTFITDRIGRRLIGRASRSLMSAMFPARRRRRRSGL